jgi:phenylpyruvate tautomerase PptA (4-oxalocrotonate tautomerase family)
MQFSCYQLEELFVGGVAAEPSRPDVTVELSDWHMSTRQQRTTAAGLTPVLVHLLDADPDAVNIWFHSYPPADFAVGGRLLSDRIPAAARLAKQILG